MVGNTVWRGTLGRQSEIQFHTRGQRTMVILDFQSQSDKTLVRFTHLGWGEGTSWDEAYDYFDHAWNEIVLPRFLYSMEVGAIDWIKPPKLQPMVSTLKVPLEAEQR